MALDGIKEVSPTSQAAETCGVGLMLSRSKYGI